MAIVLYIFACVPVAALIIGIALAIRKLATSIFDGDDAGIALIAIIFFVAVVLVALSPAGSRAEELPEGFYYKVVFIDEVEEKEEEMLIHTDDLNNLWNYWEDGKEIDFNNNKALEELAKYFVEENGLWSEEKVETAIVRGRIVVLTMWECCEDDPFDEEVINVYYSKFVTDSEESEYD